MKQAIHAVATIALAVGLATAAQAYGTNQQGAAATTNKHEATASMLQRPTAGRVTKEQIKDAQQQLKTDGLYKGRIDGRMTHQTKVAISRFQQQNGLRRTATLDENTLARLSGGGTSSGAGVGSSMPNPSQPAAAMPSTTVPNGAGNTAPSSTAPANIGSPKQP